MWADGWCPFFSNAAGRCARPDAPTARSRAGPGAAIPTWRSSWPTPWTPRFSPRPCAAAGRCSTSSIPSGPGNRISPPWTGASPTPRCTPHAKREWTGFIHFTGLGNPAHLSDQLRSRYEVGEILALGGARVTQLRAPLVLGSGGASFEMIQAFCGYLRVMFAPRWMDAKCQPIAIANVIEYLAGCLEHPETAGQVYEIGGPEVLTWRELFHIYAEEAGLPQRLVLVLPLRIHRISIWWMNLVTPVSVALIRPLVERMRDEILCRDERIREIVPQKLLSCREAIIKALERGVPERGGLQLLRRGLHPSAGVGRGAGQSRDQGLPGHLLP